MFMPRLADARARIGGWLACPVCKGALTDSGRILSCSGCGRGWPQTDDFVDLLPTDAPEPASGAWAGRQRAMADSYRDLVADPEHAVLAYRSDLEPYRALLADASGRVLDVGGGNGLVRAVLPRGVDYVSLDPLLDWLDESWSVVADDFSCLRQPLQFVRGVAEHLPFADRNFDTVLSLWSLNHCADPQRAIAEVARVIRPSGRFVLVLEEVEPPCRDILNSAYVDHRSWTRRRLAWEKLIARVKGWPLQPDHLRITEADVMRWTSGRFAIVSRAWHGSYLTLELSRGSSRSPGSS
jgi:ubiquinone/menaquinone biosynthesis C-methylase UbiE